MYFNKINSIIYLSSSIALTLALNSSVILFTVGFTISSQAWLEASSPPPPPLSLCLSSSDSKSSSSLLPRRRIFRYDVSESESELESRRLFCLRRLRSLPLSPLLERRRLRSFLRLFLWRDLDLERRFLLLSGVLPLDLRLLLLGLSSLNSSESEDSSTTELAGATK